MSFLILLLFSHPFSPCARLRLPSRYLSFILLLFFLYIYVFVIFPKLQHAFIYSSPRRSHLFRIPLSTIDDVSASLPLLILSLPLFFFSSSKQGKSPFPFFPSSQHDGPSSLGIRIERAFSSFFPCTPSVPSFLFLFLRHQMSILGIFFFLPRKSVLQTPAFFRAQRSAVFPSPFLLKA